MKRRRGAAGGRGFDYGAWAEYLTDFARGKDRPTTGLSPLTKDVGSSAANRLIDRLAGALLARMDLWSAALDRDIEASHTLSAFENAWALARKRLGPICALVTSDLFADEIAESLVGSFRKSLENTQAGIEGQLAALGSGFDAELDVVRRSPLPAVLAGEVSDEPASPPTIGRPGVRRRPIIT